MKNMNFKGAIFDLDGVLTETSEQHYDAWRQLAEELQIPFDKGYNELLKGVSRMASLELILKRGDLAEAYTEEEKRLLANKKNDFYQILIKDFSPSKLFEGVDLLLDQLREQGIKIALASASNNAPFLLKAMGVDQKFDAIMDPMTIVNGKPDPEIFLKAAGAIGVEPGACIGFEDSIAGIKAIKSAGMVAVGIGNESTLREADLVLSHISMAQALF